QDDEETRSTASYSDKKEIQAFYKWYFEKFISDGATKRERELSDDMAKHYQIASVLYDVLKTVIPPENVDDEIRKYAREVERKKVHYAQYNILPLHYTGTPPPIMKLPEIRAAVTALCNIVNLPMPRVPSTVGAQDRHATNWSLESDDKPTYDLLDWLGLTFGFQKGNVENQREHLILLLANVDIRKKANVDSTLLEDNTVIYLQKKVFKNYKSWCAYLHQNPNIKFPGNSWSQQLDLLYIGLYFLIWGEASNIRFMPECICYIFHNVSSISSLLDRNIIFLFLDF
ncbi:hypothetical protein Taro_009521, partial [Colocasia esculenta]|nr:hypothetical protein [Colocasia esculenta]